MQIVPDPDVPPAFIGPQRNTTITIETDTIKGQPAKGIRDPGGPHAAFSETFQDAVFRLAKSGPNTMASMLELNQWVTDNNYNPYTSQLPVGSGVKYYKDIPVTAGPTTTMTNTIQGNVLTPDGGVLPSVINPPIHPSPLNDLGAILNPTPNPNAPSTGNVPANTPVEVPRTGGIRR